MCIRDRLYDYFKSGVELIYTTVDGQSVLQNPEALQAILPRLFASLGVIFLVVTVPLGAFMRNPPKGYVPAGWTPPLASSTNKSEIFTQLTATDCILSGRFLLMWLVFFCNIVAGIAIIGFQSPLFQDLWRKVDPSLDIRTLAGYGASLILSLIHI